MPELPEVEVVRRGLVPALTGALITDVWVADGRSLKRHISLSERQSDSVFATHGRTLTAAQQQVRAADFKARLTGSRLLTPARRGKFLWVPLSPERPDAAAPSQALFAHLAMSGQLLLREVDAPDDKHVRIRLLVQTAQGREIRMDFADQRRFGSLAIDPLIPITTGKHAGWGDSCGLLPAQAAHIARDLLDTEFNSFQVAKILQKKPQALKKLLLEQQLLSGIGNIYADEALWQARVHPEQPAASMSVRRIESVLAAAADVMERALEAGGTSFDELYVNTQGEAGYFARLLHAYGRQGLACDRCAHTIARISVAGRSSHFCPKCQRLR